MISPIVAGPVFWAGNQWIAYGTYPAGGGAIETSPDGINWTIFNNLSLSQIVWKGSLTGSGYAFVGSFSNTGEYTIVSSVNGSSWVLPSTVTKDSLYGGTCSGVKWVSPYWIQYGTNGKTDNTSNSIGISIDGGLSYVPQFGSSVTDPLLGIACSFLVSNSTDLVFTTASDIYSASISSISNGVATWTKQYTLTSLFSFTNLFWNGFYWIAWSQGGVYDGADLITKVGTGIA